MERKSAEQKRYHDLDQARYWGLAKVTLQALVTCLVVNCKRLAKLLAAGTASFRGGLYRADQIGGETRRNR
ncbi:MAG: transposase [Candidatus Zipacnadales bacterium]